MVKLNFINVSKRGSWLIVSNNTFRNFNKIVLLSNILPQVSEASSKPKCPCTQWDHNYKMHISNYFCENPLDVRHTCVASRPLSIPFEQHISNFQHTKIFYRQLKHKWSRNVMVINQDCIIRSSIILNSSGIMTMESHELPFYILTWRNHCLDGPPHRRVVKQWNEWCDKLRRDP